MSKISRIKGYSIKITGARLQPDFDERPFGFRSTRLKLLKVIKFWTVGSFSLTKEEDI